MPNTEFEPVETMKIMDIMLSALTQLDELNKLCKRKRSVSVRRVNRNRDTQGYFKTVFLRIKREDPEEFFIHTRMSPKLFDVLLRVLKRSLVKHSIRQPIEPECRLAVTLTYLAMGVSFQWIAQSFKLGKETVRKIVLETCSAIWQVLSPWYVSEPSTAELQEIKDQFFNRWQFPNCVGAIDGKHIAIKCTKALNGLHFNKKRFTSIALMAACDAKYTFTYVNAGAYGSQSAGGFFQASGFGQRIIKDALPLPADAPFPGTETPAYPNFFVANAAFPLTKRIMKPFHGAMIGTEKEYFNKRLNRACSVIENSLGILIARWRVLLGTLNLSPENAERIILACVALHNFIMRHNDVASYCPVNFIDSEDVEHNFRPGEWRTILNCTTPFRLVNNAQRFGGQRTSNFREELCSYINRNKIS